MDERAGVTGARHSIKSDLNHQLQRQSVWLRDSWLWLLDKKVFGEMATPETKPTALDVGCGPGFVMKLLERRLNLQGIDIDPRMVDECISRGLRAEKAAAEALPFEDASFDIVYCSFLLLWTKDPVKVVSEMSRVSKRWVICLAEPDFGGRIDYPDEISALSGMIIEGIRREGGDPFVGRKLRSIYGGCALNADVGVHAGVWSIEKLREESEDEWRYIMMTATPESSGPGIEKVRGAWDSAVESGSLFQFNPIFYAFGQKTRQ